MPDVWTHIIGGQQVIDGLGREFKEAALVRKKLFSLGCQGPDLFFYYNFLPWDGDNRVFSLGSAMHHRKSGLFFRESLKYIKNNDDPDAVVYLMALICHWCLDRATHPYIHYISGVYQGYRSQPKKLINNHKRVEAAIDVLMGKRFLNINVGRARVYREIDVGKRLPEGVLAYYRHILPLVYRENFNIIEDGDFVNKSYRDMLAALRVLHDPWGVKRAAASLYDAICRDTRNFRFYFYKRAVKDGEMLLNEENRLWCHPSDENDRCKSSFLELFRKGVEDAVATIGAALRYIRGETGYSEICQIIKDISYNTGKPESDKRPLRYFNPVLE